MAGRFQGSSVPDKVLGALQELMLRSVLLGEPLPGEDRPLALPDLQFLRRGPVVTLVDENLAIPRARAETELRVRVRSTEELANEARRSGDVAYLQFGPPSRDGDDIRLTLQGKIAPGGHGRVPLGLSGVTVTFRKKDARWEAVAEPVYLAE